MSLFAYLDFVNIQTDDRICQLICMPVSNT